MDRSPVFSAIKALRAGKYYTKAEMNSVDSLLDSLGIARSGDPAMTEVKIGLSAADFDRVAANLGCTSAQIRAVWEVESGGG